MKKLIFFLVAAVLLISSSGCQEQQSRDSSKQGSEADLRLAAAAKFLCSDGSWYLTEQKQEISIKPRAIKVTAKEPFSELILTVRGGRFIVKKSPYATVFDDELFSLMTNDTIYKSLLELYLAELKNLQTEPGQSGNIMFEGRAYELVFSDPGGTELYKNKATQRKELVISRKDKVRYVSYGYNYLKNWEGGYFPSKIDIYIYYTDKSDKKMIAQFSCRLL